MYYGKYIEDANESGIIDKYLSDVSINATEALCGSFDALKNLYDLVLNTSSRFQNQIFMFNFSKFIRGLNLDEERKDKLKEILTGDDDSCQKVRRVLQCLEKIDTEKKVDFIVNTTNALINEDICVGDYFRICQAIVNTLDEDLEYLKEQILDGNQLRTNLSYCYAVQGLLNSGLMYETSVAYSPVGGYCFSKFGLLVDKYSLSYTDMNKYNDFDINAVTMGPTLWLDTNG